MNRFLVEFFGILLRGNLMSLLSIFADQQRVKAYYNDRSATHQLEMKLEEFFSASRHRPTVILCIGTDRSTGDSLGPLTGSYLKRLNIPHLTVIGTLEEPVHATNLKENLDIIKDSFFNPYILAIDACLGKLDSVGHITLASGPLKPGAGVHKDLPSVGEAHLTGIVNVGGFMEYMVLQNTRLSLVWNMAESIGNLLSKAYVRSRI